MFGRSLLKQSKRQQKLISAGKNEYFNVTIGRAMFSSQPERIDYYAVLGLKNTASNDQIKEAYRRLAMKYHPDVNTTGETHQPDADKFREIAEAYAVLSIPESKMSYDQTNIRKADAVYSSIKSETIEKNRKMRDSTGHVPGPKPVRGSYAESRLKQLEKEREMFNVNHLGYYKGGLPQKDAFNVRKGSLSNPGMFHNPKDHNTIVRPERDAFEIGIKEAREYKNAMLADFEIKQIPKTYHPLETDPEWRFVKDRTFATWIIFGIFGFVLAKRIYKRERARAHWTERLAENLEEKPAHHFVNRGGVLMKKEFDGFAQYFKNDKELTDWYFKVYPNIMKGVAKE